MSDWRPNSRVKQLINDWWPDGMQRISDPHAFMRNMAALQADLIRYYLSSMDNVTGMRAINTLRWLDRKASGLE